MDTHESTEIDMSKKVKVGIIGTGWIAEAHALSYKSMPDVEVVAMADLIPGKAEAFAKKFGFSGKIQIVSPEKVKKEFYNQIKCFEQ